MYLWKNENLKKHIENVALIFFQYTTLYPSASLDEIFNLECEKAKNLGWNIRDLTISDSLV